MDNTMNPLQIRALDKFRYQVVRGSLSKRGAAAMREMHDLMGNVDRPLSDLSLDTLHPGQAGLSKILANYR